jgi:hypothetical protein
MPKMNLVIALMTLTAIIIIGLAVYIFSHASGGVSLTQIIILLAAAVIGLFVVLLVLLLMFRGMNSKK